ncbi:MAG TPA: pyridoxamine 5'-phosphate oxidase family protein [Nitrososphaerales archaeon]|nr:pyridoxamine 5'-phosphate oxidase family protein [Nitrososphaerales archaeon]
MPGTMTAEEVIEFVNEQRNAIIATVRKNGAPHTAWNPVAYVDNALYAYADPASVCYRNLVGSRRASLAVALGNRAIFIEGIAKEKARVNEVIGTLLAKIFSVVENWIPKNSYNYSSLLDCKASIFDIKIEKILTYKESVQHI